MKKLDWSRRTLIKSAAISTAAPFIWTSERAFAADTITVADVGGAPGAAVKKAFYEPFEKETGIRIVGVAHEPDPTTQFKLIVDTKNFIWDVCSVTPIDLAHLTHPKGYVDALHIDPKEYPTVVPGMITPVWAGFSIWTTMLGYRADKFPNGAGPQSWVDFWDVKKFPGRRGLYKNALGALDVAVLAAGVPASKLYPLDVDLGFKMLDQIKPHINVWWTSGAHNTQILQSGEVAMTPVWSGRAFAAIDGGAPVKVVWNDGLYSSDGWCIPKGTPRGDLARKFIRFCMNPDLQAIFSNNIANAPSNTKAFQYINPDRAERLATAPQNIRHVHPRDDFWWAENRAKLQERFENWLLS